MSPPKSAAVHRPVASLIETSLCETHTACVCGWGCDQSSRITVGSFYRLFPTDTRLPTRAGHLTHAKEHIVTRELTRASVEVAHRGEPPARVVPVHRHEPKRATRPTQGDIAEPRTRGAEHLRVGQTEGACEHGHLGGRKNARPWASRDHLTGRYVCASRNASIDAGCLLSFRQPLRKREGPRAPLTPSHPTACGHGWGTPRREASGRCPPHPK